jgi:hypothetical protein
MNGLCAVIGRPAMSDKKTSIELHSDAWSRFIRAIDVVGKSPPQNRAKAKAKTRIKRKVAKKVR